MSATGSLKATGVALRGLKPRASTKKLPRDRFDVASGHEAAASSVSLCRGRRDRKLEAEALLKSVNGPWSKKEDAGAAVRAAIVDTEESLRRLCPFEEG
mmetsp:Transcript_10147/g.22469  ORF Transcript_10147/g.22469 Transcript_10147/m.22469 type:complete len:99 (+) Transcript_10147:283-579(+)